MEMTSRPSNLSPRPSIQLHIERLVPEGLPISHAEGSLVGAAVETELARLPAMEGLAVSASSAEPHIVASHIHLIPDGSPHIVGQQIGHAVLHVLNQCEHHNRKGNTS